MSEKINIETIRHSLSHILAMAVFEMFPEAKLAIGPAIENGFYYDFDLPRTLIPEDLPILEEKMRKIIGSNLAFEKIDLSNNATMKQFNNNNQTYKVELIKDLQADNVETVSLYKTGSFTDLCKGPHIKSTADLKGVGFKLEKIAGAYWKGNEKNKMLQRIYGLAFETKKELDDYLKQMAEAEKRDHRKLGEVLGLFLMDDKIGAGLPLWLPKGEKLRMIIEHYLISELEKAEYQMVKSPHIALSKLWETSGHMGFYRDNMYSPFKVDEHEFLIKPMNCPFHLSIYKHKIRSYRDLPIRYAEFGTVYRYEKTGVLHGLMRVRGFTQDDAHIFCQSSQVEEEIKKAVSFAIQVLKHFGFSNFDIYLSTKPKKAVGNDHDWKLATRALKNSLESENLKYQIDPGEGVFYGPKIDIKVKDLLGRSWQCTTVQVDFNLPERFGLEYIDCAGKKARPIMIHRALLGSFERFIGLLIEHFAGAFPIWLAPVQAIVLPISDKHTNYANRILGDLKLNNIRAEIDNRAESIGKKIRDAEMQKIPNMLIIGNKECLEKKVSLRSHGDCNKLSVLCDIGSIIKKITN